jgi:hypothetical protein
VNLDLPQLLALFEEAAAAKASADIHTAAGRIAAATQLNTILGRIHELFGSPADVLMPTDAEMASALASREKAFRANDE